MEKKINYADLKIGQILFYNNSDFDKYEIVNKFEYLAKQCVCLKENEDDEWGLWDIEDIIENFSLSKTNVQIWIDERKAQAKILLKELIQMEKDFKVKTDLFNELNYDNFVSVFEIERQRQRESINQYYKEKFSMLDNSGKFFEYFFLHDDVALIINREKLLIEFNIKN